MFNPENTPEVVSPEEATQIYENEEMELGKEHKISTGLLRAGQKMEK